MPLPRPLLQLCALLLIVFAAAAAHAAAPPYGPNEVEVTITRTPGSTTRSAQSTSCRANGCVLLPMVTDAVYQKTLSQMDSSNIEDALGFMGGSSLLSPATCTTSKASLDCIWYWDEGRYAGAENAMAFYKGNRNAKDLPGARMISNLVGNYWRINARTQEKYPGSLMQRYGMAIQEGAAVGWVDTSATTWIYGYADPSEYHTFCACPTTTTTTTTTTPFTTSTTTEKPTTTTTTTSTTTTTTEKPTTTTTTTTTTEVPSTSTSAAPTTFPEPVTTTTTTTAGPTCVVDGCARCSVESTLQCNACLADYFLTETGECVRYCDDDGASMPANALATVLTLVAAVRAVAGG